MIETKSLFKNLNESHIRSKVNGSSERILSVDSLRGFDMFWIIGGGLFLENLNLAVGSPLTSFLAIQMDHVEWFGFRFYDIIMPLFLFIVGVALPFSFRRRLANDPSISKLWPHILKRVALLWLFGMLVQGHLLTYSVDKFHLYSNTLQAIAAGYLIASFVMIYLKVAMQIVATLLMMLLYWAIMEFVPVPGFGAGVCTPDGNFAIYLDKLVFGSFQDGTTYTWIVSSLNFGATTLLGVFIGYLLQSALSGLKKIYYMVGIGTLLVIVGLIMNIWNPIVKHIWTGSFVFFSGGLCVLLLAFFYLVIDYWKIQTKRRFFIIIGSNAIFAYLASHLFDWRLIADVFLGGLKQYTNDWYPLIRGVGGFSALFFVLWQMQKHKIFLKI